jgi:hypothetical protein
MRIARRPLLSAVVARRHHRRENPFLLFMVREVITMGTPIIGGPKYTTPRPALRQVRQYPARRLSARSTTATAWPAALTVLYSDRDGGIVGPDIARTSTMPSAISGRWRTSRPQWLEGLAYHRRYAGGTRLIRLIVRLSQARRGPRIAM